MNPLGNGNALPTINPALKNIVETLKYAQSFKNPQAFLQELGRQNPEMARQLVQLSQTVKNPMQAAEQMLAQQGITPEQIRSMLNQ